MAILNYLNCASVQGHTGLPTSCSHNPDLLQYILAVPKGTVWNAAALADIQTTIQNGLVNDTYSSGYHLFGKFTAIDNQSEDRQQETLAYGDKVTTRDAQYYWTFRYNDGYMCKHKAYLKFKGRENEFEYFMIDKSRNVIGTEAYDANGFLTGIKGLTFYEFYEQNWMPKDGSNDSMFQLSVGLANSKELNEYYAFVTLGFDISTLDQIIDVVLSPLTTLDGGAVTVSVLAGCGGQNLVKLTNDWADPTLFSVKNTATGATITITGISVTGVGDNQALLFDIDEADADYPTSTNELTITGVAPSVIEAAVGGFYRTNSITLTEV